MALARTTLSTAMTVNDSKIIVASATGFAAGYLVRIDGECFEVTKAYVSGSTTVPVTRGQDGTAVTAHVSGAGVVVGVGSDWSNPSAQTVDTFPIAGKARTLTSYSASGAIALPAAGSDAVAFLNGTSVLAMTVAAPTKEMDGSMLYIASNGAAAHTIDFTGGLSGAGSSYNLLTVNATAPVLMGPFMAVNSLWQCAAAVALAGNAANVTATVG